MQHFDSDYMEGTHPLILQKLLETNMEKTAGYGSDAYCNSAKEKIRKACGCLDAEIHFLIGGTQTNATVIKGLLRPYEGVIAPESGHVSVHEAGAIEAGGHKVLPLPCDKGKLSATLLSDYLFGFYQDENHAHMVQPGMVYLSYPTEYGTLYSKKELEAIYSVCHAHKLPLYMDGARLGYGLMSKEADVTLADIAANCDAFYIGGTKVGALFGEAVVFKKPGLIPNFFTLIKQQGALLAKGRLLGIQFDTLFTDDLYFQISRHAIDMAEKMKQGFKDKGYSFFFDSPTNQQFLILENTQMKKLAEKVSFGFWESLDASHSVVRFATSFATKESDVEELISLL